nr:MAG TPA: hypothetical protein [Caudoviricetes sp.]
MFKIKLCHKILLSRIINILIIISYITTFEKSQPNYF